MKRQILIILISFFCTAIFGQDQLKLSRGTKTFTLKTSKNAYFYQNVKKPNGDSIYFYYDGSLEKISSDSLIIKPKEIDEFIYYADKRAWQRHTFLNDDTISRISLHINKIDKILVDRQIAKASLYTALLAGISIIAVSPLASINYKAGTFDKNRYATIAGISTGVFIPTLVIGIKFSYKKYNLQSGKNRWTIKK